MVYSALEPLVAAATSRDSALDNLEKLGAYFTSQIHDLNNQVAVLSNAELLHSLSDLPVEPGTTRFLDQLFTSIRRLSATSDRLNEVRKIFPLSVTHIPCADAAAGVVRAAESNTGWTLSGNIPCSGKVQVNPRWIAPVVEEIMARIAPQGVMTLSVGELPVRHYQQVLRRGFADQSREAFLVHFHGEAASCGFANRPENGDYDYEIAVELVRLMGAGLSLGLSDDPLDVLLAFRLSDEEIWAAT